MNNAKLLLLTILSLLTTTFVMGQAGSLDTTFGNGGKLIGGNITATGFDVAVQTDGKIVVAGTLDGKFAVFRFNTNGTSDTTFGTNGSVTTEFYTGYGGSANAIVVQPNGRIVAGGSTDKAGSSLFDGTDFAVARFLSNGSLDASFGSGTGKVTANIANDRVKDIAVQPDGKIVFTGDALERVASQNYIGRNIFAIRFNADGTPDTAFGTNGTATASYRISTVCPVLNEPHNPEALALQSDGKIIVSGYVSFCDPSQPSGYSGGAAIVRFLSNGQLDNSFDSDGKVLNSDISSANAVTVQSDGKIIAVGQSGDPYGNPSVPYDFGILRYTTNGTLDTSFDGDGKVVTSIESYNDIPRDVLVQPNGKIVVVGESSVLVTGFSITNFAIARLNPDGSLDSSFDGDGKAITDINNGDLDSISRSVIQPDGKILVVGFTKPNNGSGSISRLALARYIGDAPVARRPPFDFDGDGRADQTVFRSAGGNWYSLRSGSGFTAAQFGLSSDKIVPADFDGDGRTDIAVYRDGTWYWLNSSNGTFQAVQFGQAGDIPIPADYTGDGRAELAVYRGGFWYTLNLTGNQFQSVQFGLPTDKPVPADFDGDGKTDIAVVRQGGGLSNWYILGTNRGFYGLQFGIDTDKLVPADYDGDGKADIAVYRNGFWYVFGSTQGFFAVQFGIASDIPTAADYDGDGKTDFAVYRDGIWYLLRSQLGFGAVQFGIAGDRPIPAAYIP